MDTFKQVNIKKKKYGKGKPQKKVEASRRRVL